MKKNEVHKKQLEIQKKILEVSEKHLCVGTEHRDISEKQAKESMSLLEQRIWWILSLLVVVVLSGVLLSLFNQNDKQSSDLKIDIFPQKIKLNEAGPINFELNFTNIGKKNVTGFNILKINLYRMEDGKAVYLRQLIVPWQQNQYTMSCNSQPGLGIGYNGGDLPVDKSCLIKFSMTLGCPECFDDKDKTPMLYVYLDSLPPMENRIINLSIY